MKIGLKLVENWLKIGWKLVENWLQLYDGVVTSSVTWLTFDVEGHSLADGGGDVVGSDAHVSAHHLAADAVETQHLALVRVHICQRWNNKKRKSRPLFTIYGFLLRLHRRWLRYCHCSSWIEQLSISGWLLAAFRKQHSDCLLFWL